MLQHTMSHRPPPELGNDAIREILARISPEQPELLVRAACVCRAWRDILSDPAFRKFHRTRPALLGIFRNDLNSGSASFVPTTAFRPTVPVQLRWVHDARHGRVLLKGDREELAVWDPITDAQERVLWPAWSTTVMVMEQSNNLAVLCATVGCDHRGCHGGPFVVVFAYRSASAATSVGVYPSRDGAWSGAASVEHPDDDEDPDETVYMKPCSVVVGNTVYLSSRRNGTSEILEYNMGNRELKVIGLPAAYYRRSTMLMTAVLMTMEDGTMGFGGMEDLSRICLWSRKAGPGGALEWAQHRTIEISTGAMMYRLAGFADGFGVIFVTTGRDGTFMVELNSGRVNKVAKETLEISDIPYSSFYTLGSSLHSSTDHP